MATTTTARLPRRFGLVEQVLAGLIAGVLAGIFFGEIAAPLKTVGDAFILLLQVTVIPYVLVSLITALGRLELQDARDLGLYGGAVLLLIWGIGLVVVLLAPVAFPDWPSASFFSTSQIEERPPVDFLRLYIPSNPFYALANAIIPAIVVFAVLIGLALIGTRNKQAVLTPLAVMADALMRVAGFIAKLAPVGVFALTASAAGTIDIEDLSRLQVYLVIYVALALILALWVLPGLAAVVTPLRQRDILRAYAAPLITAFATANLLIVLPALAEATKRLLKASAPVGNRVDRLDAQSGVDVLIPAAFNFPNLGTILSLLFVLFAGWYIGAPIGLEGYPVVAFVGLASLFGGTVLTIPFLLDLLQLPQDLFQVFLAVDVLASRFGTLLAGMSVAIIALVGGAAMSGPIRLSRSRLLRFVVVSALLVFMALAGIRAFYSVVVVAPYTKAEALRELALTTAPQPSTVDALAPDVDDAAFGRPATFDEILTRGSLRVCYSPDDYPSAFAMRDKPQSLVGFDIDIAHRFAKSLNLSIDFVRAPTMAEAIELFDGGVCDIRFAAGTIDPATMTSVRYTVPVYVSAVGLIVRDHERDRFTDWTRIRRRGDGLSVAIPASSAAMTLARQLMPAAQFTFVATSGDVQQELEAHLPDVEAVADLAEEGAALTLLYPEYSMVVPRPPVRLPVVYAVPRESTDLLEAFNAWSTRERATGAIEMLYEYWMLGEASEITKPRRWSIIRNVLHWVD